MECQRAWAPDGEEDPLVGASDLRGLLVNEAESNLEWEATRGRQREERELKRTFRTRTGVFIGHAVQHIALADMARRRRIPARE